MTMTLVYIHSDAVDDPGTGTRRVSTTDRVRVDPRRDPPTTEAVVAASAPSCAASACM